MSLKALTKFSIPNSLQDLDTPPRPDHMKAWSVNAFNGDDQDNVITIYDVIGDDGEGGGVTAKRVSAALRRIGDREVKVRINSPGGAATEGEAIYTMLGLHPAKVVVEIVGIAASAASIIAMAGDEVRISPVGKILIHNVWGLVIGNRNDLSRFASEFEVFDRGMASVYSSATGADEEAMLSLMDKDRFMSAQEAKDLGFVGEIMEFGRETEEVDPSMQARRTLETLLQTSGRTRSEVRKLLKAFKSGTPSAAVSDTPRAVQIDTDKVSELISLMKS